VDDLDFLIRLFRDPIHDGFCYNASPSHGDKELDERNRVFVNMGL
jgi:hypothetical protein